jgi:hypothetical protein
MMMRCLFFQTSAMLEDLGHEPSLGINKPPDLERVRERTPVARSRIFHTFVLAIYVARFEFHGGERYSTGPSRFTTPRPKVSAAMACGIYRCWIGRSSIKAVMLTKYLPNGAFLDVEGCLSGECRTEREDG